MVRHYKIIFMKKIIISLFILCIMHTSANAYVDYDNAVLRIMNKAAGKSYTVKANVGNDARFEKLHFTVRACKQTDPFQAEDFFAFVEISDASGKMIFSNWMSRNEPGRNPLQNADYDVWLVKCE